MSDVWYVSLSYEYLDHVRKWRFFDFTTILGKNISLFELRIYWIFSCHIISCEWKIRLKLDVAYKCILWIFSFFFFFFLLIFEFTCIFWFLDDNELESQFLVCKSAILLCVYVGQVLFFTTGKIRIAILQSHFFFFF
jgi:hypothetical protein